MESQSDPRVAVAQPVVRRQRRARRPVVAVETGQQPQAHHRLEAVTDAERQAARLDELEQLVVELVADLVGEHEARAEVVAEREAADERQHAVVGQPRCIPALQQVEQVHLLGLGADHPESLGGLDLAVESEAGDDQDAHVLPQRRFLDVGESLEGLQRFSHRRESP